MGQRSINLTKRNELVCKKFFKTKGRRGGFSKWVNDMMNKEFTLDGIEGIRNQMRENSKKIHDMEANQEKLLKKLRILIDKEDVEK